MNVKPHHPLAEIIARCLHGIETIPIDAQRQAVKQCCKEAIAWHNKEMFEEFNAQATNDLVASNIDTIRGIHEKTLHLISKLCSESLSAHPHYEDSYPPTLAIIEKSKNPVENEGFKG